VPIFIRTGWRLPIPQTELRLVFEHAPRVAFHATRSRPPEPMQLVIELDPATGVRLLVEAQRGHAVESEQISLDMEFAEEGGEGPTRYRLRGRSQ
jgi:glucose-6-phosphate 1-dehydrogenase